ncbi:MAG TPA: LPXTG cell wall anchor domain-containing protein [Chloroflexota bacterium]|nr:LPXTG cell wall anchor domain-containing protein [Chloroflexota bacterium]
MLWKALRVVLAVCVLQLLYLGIGHAQDFSSLIQQAATANQQWLTALDTAGQATDLATLKSDAATALALGKQTQSLLQQALPLAPDDAARSRVSGLLAHVNNAVTAGDRIANETTLSAAQSDLNAERAEANEAMSELKPFAQPTAPTQTAPTTSSTTPSTTTTTSPTTTSTAPTTLPTTGGTPWTAVVALGLATMLAGAGLRKKA